MTFSTVQIKIAMSKCVENFIWKLSLQYSTWSLLWLGWNVFVICLYLEVGILKRVSIRSMDRIYPQKSKARNRLCQYWKSYRSKVKLDDKVLFLPSISMLQGHSTSCDCVVRLQWILNNKFYVSQRIFFKLPSTLYRLVIIFSFIFQKICKTHLYLSAWSLVCMAHG